MSNKTQNQITAHQKQLHKIYPVHLQTVKLLKYSEDEIEDVVEKELEENPALEKDEQEDLEKLIDYDSNYDYHKQKNNLYNQIEPFNTFKSSIYENLQSQIEFLSISQEEKQIVLFIAGSLDKDGFLRKDLTLIANDLQYLLNIKIDKSSLEKLLNLLQTLEPTGIGSRDIKEYLVIKINKNQEKRSIKQLAISIIMKYNNLLAANNPEKFAQKFKNNTLDEINKAISLIKSFSYKPVEENDLYSKNKSIVPDFIINIVAGNPQIQFFNEYEPRIRINNQYRSILNAAKKNDKIDDAFVFAKHAIDKAFFFISALKQRKKNLKAIAEALVYFQRDFFLSESSKDLKPLKMKQVAEHADVDISTVSRVVCDRYIQTDMGIYAMKHFFSSGLISNEGKKVSNIEVKQKILEIIKKENKNNPYSDEEIFNLLRIDGYKIARRTISKYRSVLNIPTSSIRARK